MPAVPTFWMLAYTGAVMRVEGLWTPVIFDLSGVEAPAGQRPVLRGHDHEKIVGHADRVRIGKAVEAWGVLSGMGLGHADEVAVTAAKGFPWQVSVGAAVRRTEFLEDGDQDEVNGRLVEGPLCIARASTLNEFSFVPLGADGDTRARVNAAAAHRRRSSTQSSIRRPTVTSAERLLCNIAAAASGGAIQIQTVATRPGTSAAEVRQLVADGLVRIEAGRPVATTAGERRARLLTARSN